MAANCPQCGQELGLRRRSADRFNDLSLREIKTLRFAVADFLAKQREAKSLVESRSFGPVSDDLLGVDTASELLLDLEHLMRVILRSTQAIVSGTAAGLVPGDTK